MAWYSTGVDHVTTITASIWNDMITYIRGHKAEHITGGGDIIPVATTSKTGLCRVLDGDPTHYLDGSGNLTTPAGTVTNVTGTAPIVSSGGATLAISISAATPSLPGSMSASDKTKLDAIEAAADVTDNSNVDTAGAVMETDYNAFTVLAADTDNTPAPLTVGASTIVGRASTGGIVALTKLQGRTLLGVDAIHLYPMGAIVPTTSPATVDQAELSNGLNYVYGEYSYTAYNILQWMITLPVELAAATFTIAVEWLTTSASANTVYWDIYGVRVGNGTTRDIDLLSKNLVTVTDTNTGASYTNWSDESAAVTITGTGNTVHLQVSRDYTTDTLDAEARLLSVRLTPVI